MADAFANLSKQERIEKAVTVCTQDPHLSANRAAKIYKVSSSTITQRLNHEIKPKRLIDETKQHLTAVEERTLVRWVTQYNK